MDLKLGTPVRLTRWNKSLDQKYYLIHAYTDFEEGAQELSATAWTNIKKRYADTIQLSFLRALTISGAQPSLWSPVLENFDTGKGLFVHLNKMWFAHQQVPNWHWFIGAITNVYGYTVCFPAVSPDWLFEYGYTQRQYLADLSEYWVDIADEYYCPWSITRIGEDILAIEAIKRIGEEAREEMNELVELACDYMHQAEE